jgi:hypothetical protein
MDQKSRPFQALEFFGRIGFISYGLTFVCVGTASCILIPRIHKAAGLKVAMLDLVGNFYGKFLLLAIAAGLVGFSIWRFLQSFCDAENKGRSAPAIFMRFIYAILGCFYLWLTWTLIDLLRLGPESPGHPVIQREVAWLLCRWWGIAVLWITVLILVGLGIYEVFLTVTGNFRDTMLSRRASPAEWNIVVFFGRIGFAALGVLFIMVAVLLIRAIIDYNPSEAGAQGEAITALLRIPFGMVFAIAESVGLIIYGLFQMSMIKYRYVFRSEKTG